MPLELLDVARRGARLDVSPVEEGVHDDGYDAPRDVDDRSHVREGRVDPAVAQKAEQVEPSTGSPGSGDGRHEDGIAREGPVRRRGVDLRDVHDGDPPGAEVEVPHLAVSHLPGRKAHVRTAGPDETMREGFERRGEGRGLREAHRVVGALLPFAEAVEYDEDEGPRSGFRRHSRGNIAFGARPGNAFAPERARADGPSW